MRGKAAAGVQHQAGQGITPAYAGKSLFCDFFGLTLTGSPPPMRGKASQVK